MAYPILEPEGSHAVWRAWIIPIVQALHHMRRVVDSLSENQEWGREREGPVTGKVGAEA